MFISIEVTLRQNITDQRGLRITQDLRDKGLSAVKEVRTSRRFHLLGLTSSESTTTESQSALAAKIGRSILADPVSEVFSVNEPCIDFYKNYSILEVAKLPGVMDTVEHSVAKAISDMGISCSLVRTSQRYYLLGDVDIEQASSLARKTIANEIIERIEIGGIAQWKEHTATPYKFEKVIVPLLDADDERLMQISKEGTLSLNIHEMRTIKSYFSAQGRNPSDIELESLAQTWSEHCVHKTLKGIIHFNDEIIDNLLASTIAKATVELSPDWCVSVFKDNAGIIKFDDNFDVTFKAETHNHPSALEPYGGAGTGIGGVIRDTLGTGLGAKPIINTDIFCFGLPDMKENDVPQGATHPRKIMDGVISGVRDYGNRMGIPTSNGAVYFDPRYIGNPLVYCGSIGILPSGKSEKEASPGENIVLLGGKTGRDGIHGATFSSVELTSESESISSGAVQIGNAIEEKKLTDAIIAARDNELFTCITDCGAGGLSSAIGEMGELCGAKVNLEVVPLKYKGLSYTEIWISEAQERMVLSVKDENLEALRKICNRERVEMTVVGKFTDTKKLELFYNSTQVCNLEMHFLHNGLPRLERKAIWKQKEHVQPKNISDENFNETLLKILASPNVASKEWIIRQYDHEVQATSVLKSLVGIENDGPGDAAVIAPVFGVNRGLIIACGMNPKYGDFDPYRMAANGIDEALRQVIAVGGDLDEAAILDNFSWADTNDPHQLGSLVLASKACYDYSMLYKTPFISGKDSLNNQFNTGDEVISIPPTLLISVLAILDDLRRVRSMDLKRAGNLLLAVGITKNEMAGSHYHHVNNLVSGGSVPEVNKLTAAKTMTAMGEANKRGLFSSIHDMSEGGLAVCIAEMAFAGGLGAKINLDSLACEDALDNATKLFSESATRWLVEIAPEKLPELELVLSGITFSKIGEVTSGKRLTISSNSLNLIDQEISELKDSWQSTFKNM